MSKPLDAASAGWSRQRVSSGAPWEASVGYSRAVRVGPFVQVAGTTASDAEGKALAPGDAYEQSRLTLSIIGRALEAAGAGFEQVVRTRIYVTDIRHQAEVGRAHGEVFGAIRPAATMVEVSALVTPEHVVEIEADAIIA